MKRPNKNEFIFSMITKKNGDYSSRAIPTIYMATSKKLLNCFSYLLEICHELVYRNELGNVVNAVGIVSTFLVVGIDLEILNTIEQIPMFSIVDTILI